VYFSGGKAGFVRMELWAGKVQNSLIGNEIGQVCPANVQKWNEFEGKIRLAKFETGRDFEKN
jgi:hypothetical protein